MKKVLIVVVGLLIVVGVALSVMAARFQPVIRPHVYIGTVPVSGLTVEEAEKRLRTWWESKRRDSIELTNETLTTQLGPRSASQWGIVLDDHASVAQISPENFWDSLGRQMGVREAPKKVVEPIFRFDEAPLADARAKIAEWGITDRPARAYVSGGKIVIERETSGFALDVPKVFDVALQAVTGNGKGILPLVEAPKRVADEELAQIKEIVSSFSTKFSAGKVARSSNIRLASKNLNGIVLMPGDTLSFNDTLGRRTVASGYRVAPVIKNGKHDFDVGGGICQVSTTLYNAFALANLKIVRRENHSLPSAYVPLGRDATVDYGSRDLVIQNNSEGPIAISSVYEPGKLTFYVLGVKEPGVEVSIVTEGARRWSRGVKLITDNSLPSGKRKVIDSGGSAASVSTYRIVKKNGVEIRRELLNRSQYSGAPKLIAVSGARVPQPTASSGPPNEAPVPDEVPIEPPAPPSGG